MLLAFACVPSYTHYAHPLLVKLVNFSFPFTSTFKHYALWDAFFNFLLSVVIPLASTFVHMHQRRYTKYIRVLWNWQPCNVVEKNPKFNASILVVLIGLECDKCFHLCSQIISTYTQFIFLKAIFNNLFT